MITTRSLLFFFMVLLVGCQSTPTSVDKGRFQLEQSHRAQAYNSRIRFLVVHYTAGDFATSLNTLTDEHVSAHYLVPAQPPLRHGKPIAWQLVDDNQAAWHAGKSAWRGYTQLNVSSIGIELENPGYQQHLLGLHWTPFPAAQIALFSDLARQIIDTYHISPQNVVAHSDIAPLRKQDPGPLFPWRALALAGIGAWPDESRIPVYLRGRAVDMAVDPILLMEKLQRYGYPVSDTRDPRQQQRVIAAFQMHFRPRDFHGRADAQTEAIVEALLEKYGPAN